MAPLDLSTSIGVCRSVCTMLPNLHNAAQSAQCCSNLHPTHIPPPQVLETEEGGYRWGKHCSFCRHDRHLKIAMLTLHFRGRRQRVVL